jgi:hypothetical protein
LTEEEKIAEFIRTRGVYQVKTGVRALGHMRERHWQAIVQFEAAIVRGNPQKPRQAGRPVLQVRRAAGTAIRSARLAPNPTRKRVVRLVHTVNRQCIGGLLPYFVGSFAVGKIV